MSGWPRRALRVLLAVFTGFIALMIILGILSQRRPDIGLVDGQLRECPNTPNCVCSVNTADEMHFVEH